MSTVDRLCPPGTATVRPSNHPVIVDGDLFSFAPCGCCHPSSPIIRMRDRVTDASSTNAAMNVPIPNVIVPC
ncbi:MAG: hypothetical protein HXY43_07040 [Fischerella sp.]|uniref:hypothetical protein n=1 Tax=Fischerella sp. TaxID=1191 RepID=UPI0017B3A86C|nr:hypothetical protein [Fischerella sp.]NWF59052.1 hypothetical protein [Fischerella sp.]